MIRSFPFLFFQHFILFNLLLVSLLVGCSNGRLTAEQKKAEIYYSHGTSHLVRKDYTSALKHLSRALELNPNDSRTNNNLGMTYYFKGERARAIFYVKKAIELDNKNSDARNNLASIYLQMGNTDLARAQYMQILEDLVYDNQYRTYYNLALIELRSNNTEAAMKHLAKSVEDKIDYCPAHYRMGIIEKRRHNYVAALKHFKRGVKGACYQNPAPHYQAALMSAKVGKYSEAVNSLETIVKKFPESHYQVLATRKIELIKESKKDLLSKEITVDKNRGVEADVMDKIPEPIAF